MASDSVHIAHFCLDGHQHVHAAKNVMDVFQSVLKQYEIKTYRVPFETNFDKSDWIRPGTRVQFYRQIQNELKMSDHEQLPFIGYSIMGNVLISRESKVFSHSKSKNLTENVQGLDLTTENIKKCITNHDVYELMVHPGYVAKNGQVRDRRAIQ